MNSESTNEQCQSYTKTMPSIEIMWKKKLEFKSEFYGPMNSKASCSVSSESSTEENIVQGELSDLVEVDVDDSIETVPSFDPDDENAVIVDLKTCTTDSDRDEECTSRIEDIAHPAEENTSGKINSDPDKEIIDSDTFTANSDPVEDNSIDSGSY